MSILTDNMDQDYRNQCLIALKLEVSFGATGLSRYLNERDKKYLNSFESALIQLGLKESDHSDLTHVTRFRKDIFSDNEKNKELVENYFLKGFEISKEIEKNTASDDEIRKLIEDSEKVMKILDNEERSSINYEVFMPCFTSG